jgi:hypothetical protein
VICELTNCGLKLKKKYNILSFCFMIIFSGPKDIKDIFLTLKDCTAEVNESPGVVELQV